MKISSKVSWLGKRLHRPFCGVLRWSVYNHTIWPMILSSRFYSLKLFSYSLDHQGKLAFIWSFSLICVSSLPFSISPRRPALFITRTVWSETLSSGFYYTERASQREGEKTYIFIVLPFFCFCFFVFLDICVICVIIPSFNLLSVLLLSHQHFELSREKLQAHWNVLLFMLPALLSLLTRPGQHIKTRAVQLHCLVECLSMYQWQSLCLSSFGV